MDNSWTKLYHRSGLQVTVALPADVKMLLPTIEYLLGVGFLVDAPGFEPGEERLDAVAVALLSKKNDDGTKTPVVALYKENFEYKSLLVYLNNPDEIAAFEYASKLTLSKLPLCPSIGTGLVAPQRFVDKESDKYIVPSSRPFGFVMKPNPQYDPNEQDAKKKKPKNKFVRWIDTNPAITAPAADSKPISVYEKAKSAISAVESLSSNASIDWGIRLEDLRDKGEITVDQFSELAGLLMSKTEGTI